MALGTPTEATRPAAVNANSITTGSFSPTSGALLIIHIVTSVFLGTATTPSTPTDTNSNTWRLLVSQADAPSGTDMRSTVFWCIANSNTAMTVTVGFGGTTQTNITMNIVQVTGADITGPIPQKATFGTSTTGTPTATLPASLVSANSLAMGFWVSADNSSTTWTGDFTELVEFGTNVGLWTMDMMVQYKVNGSKTQAPSIAGSNPDRIGIIYEVIPAGGDGLDEPWPQTYSYSNTPIGVMAA